MPKTRVAVQRLLLIATTYCGISSCTVTQQDRVIPVAIVGVSSTLKDADLKATGQTRDVVAEALSKRGGFVIKKEFGRTASYTSLKELFAGQEIEFIRAKVGVMVAVSRERSAAKDSTLLQVFGGPTLARRDVFSVDTKNLNTGIQKVAQLVSGYGHIVFDVSTLPPRTDIYVDGEPFQSTDDQGRFRETFTWPAGEYRIKFVAWVGGTRREAEDTARLRPRRILHFRKHVNLEQ